MKKLLAILIVAAMTLGLVACGGSNTTAQNDSAKETVAVSSTTSDNAGSAEVTLDGDPMFIPVCVPLNISMGDYAKKALEVLADYVNANGGVNGGELKFEFIDGGGIKDIDGYRTAMEYAVNLEGVSGIISAFYDEVAAGYADISTDRKIPTFNFLNGTGATALSEYFWSMRTPNTQMGQILAKLVESNGAKNPVVVMENVQTWQDVSDDINEYLQGIGGGVVKNIPYLTTTTDYQSIIIDAMNTAGADSIVLLCNGDTDGVTFVQTLYTYGYENPVVSTGNIFSSDFVSKTGEEECSILIGYSELAEGLGREETDFYIKLLQDNGYDYPLSWAAIAFMDSALLLCEGARLGGGNTPEQVQAGMYLIQDYAGPMNTYSYHESMHYFPTCVYEARFEGSTIVCTGEIKLDY